MKSFFTFCQDSPTFWKKSTISSPSEVLYSGKLFAAQDGFQRPETVYKLTRTTLYQCSNNDRENLVCELEADIRWSVFLPFEEKNGTETSYGFSLSYKKSKIDFYAQSSEDLSAWVDHLEEICILQDISDDFDIKKQIGSGGQSVVMLAEFLETGEEVAVKCFLKENFVSSYMKVKLANEIEVLRSMRHPNILELYRVYEDEETIYLVMEYIEGEDLFQSLVTKGNLAPEEGQKFIENFLNLLDYLNKLKILHRDLKPENIMVTNPTDRSEFKLIDFGFATIHAGQDISDSCGSPGYAAPEILTFHRHGATVDIYSAGILFFVALAGYSPFYSSDKKKVIKKNALSQITFGKKWNTIDPKFARVITAMTNLIPEQRASVEELRALMSASQTCTVRISTRRVSCNEPVASQVPILPPTIPMPPRSSQASIVQKRLQSMC